MNFSALRRLRPRPAELVVLSFAAVIALGTALLMLPGVAARELSFVDALFTATSAVCVTGLTVVDTGSFFTPLGQGIILFLIQIGGVGIITFSAFLFYLLKGHISMTNREAVLRTVSGSSQVTVGAFLKKILVIVLCVELLGTLLLTVSFYREFPLERAFYLGLFHAISAFCNAGFSLFPDSLTRYRADPLTNIAVMLLIVIGGLGFSVLLELWHAMRKRPRFRELSLHTRIVLLTSGSLILFGAAGFYLMERTNSLREMPWWTQILVSLFHSVTSRTAGFNTVELGHLANTTLFFMIMLMFIGGASGSCAGGIKVNTFRVLWALFRGRLHGRSDVNISGRRMSQNTLTRALSVTILAFLLVAVALLILLITELGEVPHDASRGKFLELAFEAVSAFGTVGLSTGLTSELTTVGRLLIALLMFAGRVGPLTLTTILHARRPSPFRYPEEDLIIG